MIGDLDFTLAKTAIQKLIIDSPYPPTIHEVRKKALEVQQPSLPTPAEAWGTLKKNIQRYGLYRESEGLTALPPVVRETAEYMGYREICLSTDGEGILRAQFMRMYEQLMNRKSSDMMLPEQVRKQIESISGRLMLEAEVHYD